MLPTKTTSPSTIEAKPSLSSRSISSSLEITSQLQRKETASPLTKIKDPSLLKIQREKDSINSIQTNSSIENELSLITSQLTKKRNPPKPPRHQVMAHSTDKKYQNTESDLISVIKQNLKELDNVPNITLKPCKQKSVEQVPTISDTDNDRNKPNVYSPQLSPEIEFCNLEKEDNDSNSFKYKKLNRKTLKKKVSFHDEPSYIPGKKEEENEIQSFVTSVSTELRNVNAALIAAKKVNVNPREKFVPVSQTRVYPSKNPSPSPPPPQAPQRLSTKLLDMFQQKTSMVSPPPQNTVSKPPAQPLVHVSALPPPFIVIVLTFIILLSLPKHDLRNRPV
ncbi:hypothetical protein K501DRAFT_10983 [Backusella circina FSU 941]|nr:hypothetical protein K501DRAFT_10983 [Backusella circina FSU 941]